MWNPDAYSESNISCLVSQQGVLEEAQRSEQSEHVLLEGLPNMGASTVPVVAFRERLENHAVYIWRVHVDHIP
jgi:hypothetical protein